MLRKHMKSGLTVLGLGAMLTVGAGAWGMAAAAPPGQPYTGQVREINMDQCGLEPGTCEGSPVLVQARAQEVTLTMPAGTTLQRGDERMHPEELRFGDDGTFPNNKLPLLLYRQALDPATNDLASMLERRFAANDWTGSWRNGVFPFPHYHSTTHEVLGVYRGSATLRLGGEQGAKVEVRAGDVIVIPAGVAHQNLGASADFGVVGAYPGGRQLDFLRGRPGERPQADRNIAGVPLPENDPLYGTDGPLRHIWKSSATGAL